MDQSGIAGVKLRPVENGTACQFMNPEGCGVYGDRPTACRYYPVALLSMRKQDEYTDTQSYALVKEEHCLGPSGHGKMAIDAYHGTKGWKRIRRKDGRRLAARCILRKIIRPQHRQTVQAQPATVLHGLLRHRHLPQLREQRK